MSDFGGTPLVIGSVLGIRVWEVGTDWNLTSPYVDGFPWQDGEMLAECYNSSGRGWSRPYVKRTAESGHDGTHCTCGFYAYYEDEVDQLRRSADVVGIIEGYGKTQLGTKGFRAQKAKIVALAPQNGWVWRSRFRRKMQKAYPSAKVFTSEAKMLAAVKLTRYPEIASMAYEKEKENENRYIPDPRGLI